MEEKPSCFLPEIKTGAEHDQENYDVDRSFPYGLRFSPHCLAGLGGLEQDRLDSGKSHD
jgi:hypothetical protein